VCTVCVNTTFYLDVNSSCVACTTHASSWLTCQYNNATLEALSCDIYYFLNTNTCTNCTTNNAAYLTCNATNYPLSCMGGYYYISSNSPPTCDNCAGINAAWANCSDASTPTSCVSTYYLNSTPSAACLTCASIAPEVATC